MQQTTLNGRYVLADPLGGGGMAVVFLARDRILDRDVALKIMREQYAQDEEFVERFRREAINAASLSHPNIVSVYDRGETEDGRYYIAMEYISGGTLKERIDRDGPLPPRTAARVASQVAEALGAAHDRGVIHRDVKPQNILVSESGDVKVADFGIARAASATAISQTSAVLGTARYMSPEQAMGECVGPASDLYSLGVVLYEMLTGEVPFDAETPVGISMKHINEPVRPPQELNPEVPDKMNALVVRLLAKDPEARYTSAAYLIADLGEAGRAADGGGLGEARVEEEAETQGAVAIAPAPRTPDGTDGPEMGGEDAREKKRRLPRVLLAVALLTLLVGLLGWGLLDGSGGKIVGTLKGVPGKVSEAVGHAAENARRAIAPRQTKVPAVEGSSVSGARKRLEEAGLGAALRRRESSQKDTGRVLEQSVPKGTKVEEGSRILLAIGSGPGRGVSGAGGEQASAHGSSSLGSSGGSGSSGNSGFSDGSGSSGGSGGSGGGSGDPGGGSPNSAAGGSGSYALPYYSRDAKKETPTAPLAAAPAAAPTTGSPDDAAPPPSASPALPPQGAPVAPAPPSQRSRPYYYGPQGYYEPEGHTAASDQYGK